MARLGENSQRSKLFKMTMEPTIQTHPKLTLIGLKTEIGHVANSVESNGEKIGKLWGELMAILQKTPLLVGLPRVGAMAFQNPNDLNAAQDYFAGVIFESEMEQPSGLIKREIPSGDYAEFVHSGHPSEVGKTFQFIYGTWLPNSGRKRTKGDEYALYPTSFDPNADGAGIRIYIPLEPI